MLLSIYLKVSPKIEGFSFIFVCKNAHTFNLVSDKKKTKQNKQKKQTNKKKPISFDNFVCYISLYIITNET